MESGINQGRHEAMIGAGIRNIEIHPYKDMERKYDRQMHKQA